MVRRELLHVSNRTLTIKAEYDSEYSCRPVTYFAGYGMVDGYYGGVKDWKCEVR